MAETSTGAEESAAQRSRSYHVLDILRGIAAMSVVVLHFPHAFAPIAAPGAYLAVDLFFLRGADLFSPKPMTTGSPEG